MALPAYLLEQPKTNPTDVLIRQIQSLGLDAEIIRHGPTITIRNLELTETNEDQINRALRLIATHADTNRLAVDAIVQPIQENIISRYQAAGFLVHVQANDDCDDDANTLLRRAIRN